MKTIIEIILVILLISAVLGILVTIIESIVKRRKGKVSQAPASPPPSLPKNQTIINQVYKKDYLMTAYEHAVYFCIKHFLDPAQYEIIPQLQLQALVKVYHNDYLFHKIKAKSVDYCICAIKKLDKFPYHVLTPLLAIELDDATHNAPDRQERDKFVNQLLEHVGLEILHIKNMEHFDKNMIVNAVRSKLEELG